MCLVCHVKKNPNSVTLRPQHSDLKGNGWEFPSPLNSLAHSVSSWDAFFLSGEAGS